MDYENLITITVDKNLRTLTVPNNGAVFGVVGDMSVNRICFSVPRYYSCFDMSEFTPRINYANSNGAANYYEADDLKSDENTVKFTWLLSPDVTTYIGNVKFSVQLYKKEANRVVQNFNTCYTNGKVLDGFIAENYVTPEQQETLLDKLAAQVTANIDEYLENSLVGAKDDLKVEADKYQKVITDSEKAMIDFVNSSKNDISKAATETKEEIIKEIASDENVEQINKNATNIDSLKKDLTSKADKTSLVKTDRKLDALWKLNQGISYEFQTDDTEAYQKMVPSGAKVANVKSIGGKTIVWNQLNLNSEKSTTKNGISFINNKDGSWTITGTCSASDGESANIPIYSFAKHFVSGHKYLVKADKYFGENYGFAINGIALQVKKAVIINYPFNPIIFVKDKVTVDNVTMRMNFFDLTQMFGSGNEPSTPEEFEAMFSADYYPYNAGELMSAPVNEVVEQGRNLFDCYGFSCTSIPNIAAKRNIANDYGTTISTIDPTNRLIVTQNKADGSVPSDYRNGYFTIGIRGLKYNTNYILAFDFTPTKMLIVDPIMKLLVNGKSDSDNSTSDFTLNVKKHVTIKFVYNANNDAQFLELRNSGMSGIIENFQIEEGTTATTYSPYHKTSYPIPQAVLNLPGYGWSAGDARNEVNWENKKYTQRVSKYTIDGSEIIFKENTYWVMTATDFEKPRPSTKNAICVNFKMVNNYAEKWGNIIFRTGGNGFVFTDLESKFANANEVKDYFQQNNETIYYELNEEQIIDISDIIDNTFQEPIEVEAGGTLTFRNSHGDAYIIPVSSTEEYLVSLAEVAK